MAREPPLHLPNPWAAVGRDTEAGRALFALYNGYGHARSRGNDYSQINKLKTLRHIASHGVPTFPILSPPPKKPEVKVPHFSHNHYNPNEFHPIDFIPRRRRASEIIQRIRDDSYVVEFPPMPKGPLLDDAEKARLQEVFYWSHRPVGPDPVAKPVRRAPKRGSVEEQELLLNTIAGEIEDREAFLNEMEAYGKGEKYRSQILFEIQQRVGQMKLLHENITLKEKQENERCEFMTAKAPSVASYTAPSNNMFARGQGRNENTTSLRFNPFVASLQGLPEDMRFKERLSQCSRTNGASPGQRIPPESNPWRVDTQESLTPNVIRTAACGDTESSDAPAPAVAQPQPPSNKACNPNPNSNSSPNSCCKSREVSESRLSIAKSRHSAAAGSPLPRSSGDPCDRLANLANSRKGSSNSNYTTTDASANYSLLKRDGSAAESQPDFHEDSLLGE